MAKRRRDWGVIFRRAFWCMLPPVFLATPVLTGSLLGGVEATVTIIPVYAVVDLLAEGLTRSLLVALFHTLLFAAPVGAALWPIHARFPRLAVALLALWAAVFAYIGFFAVVKITP